MEKDSVKMNLSLTFEKVGNVFKTCQNFIKSYSTTPLKLTGVIAFFSSTTQAVEPAKI